jgi:hypothetical protein
MPASVYTPPGPVPATSSPTVFLAGSIEQDTAPDWQAEVVAALAARDVVLLNPRRAGWDATLRQHPDEPQFHAQVQWELDQQEAATVVAFYFAPGTQSPITLLELGLAARYPGKCVVACPPEYWRYGNVRMTCERYGMQLVAGLPELIACLLQRLPAGAPTYTLRRLDDGHVRTGTFCAAFAPGSLIPVRQIITVGYCWAVGEEEGSVRMTTAVQKILEQKPGYVRFTTRNSTYEWTQEQA